MEIRTTIFALAWLLLLGKLLNSVQAYHATVNSTAYTSTAVASGDAVTAVLVSSVQARSMLSSSADRTTAVPQHTTAVTATNDLQQNTMQATQEVPRQLSARSAPAGQVAAPAHHSSTGTVIGGVLGGACGAVALAAGWIWFQSRKHSKPLKAAVAAGMLTMPAQPQAGKKVQVYGSFEWKQGAAAAAAKAAAANASKPQAYTPPTGYIPSNSTAAGGVSAKPHNTTVLGTPGRPHAVQVPQMHAGVPATPHPSPAGNRYTGYTSGYASAQGQQLPVSYSSQAAHMQMQGAHPVPQAASLGMQQRVSAGGLQQPIAAKTFDEVWASLNKLSPIREHF